MKKFILTAVIILSACSLLAAQDLIDQRAATVNLIRPEIITMRQLNQTVDLLRQNGIDKSDEEVLDTMIGDVLLQQGAEKEGINVSDAEVIKLVRGQIGSSAAGMNDQQIKDLVRRQTGVTWDIYADKSKETIQLQKYVNKVKSSKLSNIPNPGADEIKSFYDENSRQFFVAKTIKFDHIFIDIRTLSTKEENDKARERAISYERDLKSGSRSFNQLVELSDDTASKYNQGDFGYLRIDDLNRKKLLGDDFFNSVFKLKQGEISGVIKSNMGYHIVRMNQIIEPRILALDDRINPDIDITVRQRIDSFLIMKKQEEFFKEAVEELVSDLKKIADIKIFI